MGLKGIDRPKDADEDAIPRVVALVPAWQAADFIEPTLDYLVRQTWPHLEVLISVDKSTDHTAEICCAYAQRHRNIRVVTQDERLGWIGNVNWLLAQAAGDYLLFAAHDDLLAPTYIERMVAALETNPTAAIAFSDAEITTPDGRVEICRYRALEGVISAVARGARVLRRPPYWFIVHRGVFRSSAAERIGGLKHHRAGEFAADWPWLVHMALIGENIRVPEILCWKRYGPQSLSPTWKPSLRNWYAVSVSCAAEIRRSGIGAHAKAYLLGLLWLRYLGSVAAVAVAPFRRIGSRAARSIWNIRRRGI